MCWTAAIDQNVRAGVPRWHCWLCWDNCDVIFRSSDFIAGSIPITMCTVSVSCLSIYLFIYLFMNVVSKLFFKMHLFLQIWTDPIDITYGSSLEGSAFGLCSALWFGDFWRFGALRHFLWFGVKFRDILYYRSVDFSAYHLVTAWLLIRCVGMCVGWYRVCILGHNGWLKHMYTSFCELFYSNENNCRSKAVEIFFKKNVLVYREATD